MSSQKTKHWWVSIAGNHCEPAAVKGRLVYTLGCPDPFDLDKPDCPAVLVEECDHPLTPAQKKYQLRKQREALRAAAAHGYRRDLAMTLSSPVETPNG